MAVTNINGVEHRYAGNPKLQDDDWVAEFPPIKTNSRYLINKYTGEIVPNLPELATRSDILEPYFGDVADTKSETEVIVRDALTHAEDSVGVDESVEIEDSVWVDEGAEIEDLPRL